MSHSAIKTFGQLATALNEGWLAIQGLTEYDKLCYHLEREGETEQRPVPVRIIFAAQNQGKLVHYQDQTWGPPPKPQSVRDFQ